MSENNNNFNNNHPEGSDDESFDEEEGRQMYENIAAVVSLETELFFFCFLLKILSIPTIHPFVIISK